jgi:hypothetical protein
MSSTKKVPGVLITATEASGTVDDEGNIEVEEVRGVAEPVMIEYEDDDAGEVVYDASEAKGGSTVGYSRTYAANWEGTFGKKGDRLPN